MNKQFVTNVVPTDDQKNAALEKMVSVVAEALLPEIKKYVDQRLKDAGVSGAGGDMAANLSQYMPPPADDDRWNTLPEGDAPRASNGRKMPSSLTDLYELPD